MVQKFQGHTGGVRSVATERRRQARRHRIGRTAQRSFGKRPAARKSRAFQGHTGTIYGVALSRDGKHVLTGSMDKTAILWDAASGKKIQTFEGHSDSLWRGPERRRQARPHRVEDKTAILWDAASGTKIRTFHGHTAVIRGVALSGDGKHVLTGSDDNTAILWDAANGTKIRTFQGHTGNFSCSWPFLAMASLSSPDQRTAQRSLWDAANGKKIRTFEGHTPVSMSVALSGEGNLVLTGSATRPRSCGTRRAARDTQTSRTPAMSATWP